MRRIIYAVPIVALLAFGLILVFPKPRPSPKGNSPADTQNGTKTPPLPPTPAIEREIGINVDPEITAGSIRIYAHAGGHPLPDVRVMLMAVSDHETAPLILTTGPDGQAQAERVPVGDWEVYAKHRQYVPVRMETKVKDRRDTPVTLELIEGARIFGAIVDREGRAIPGAETSLLHPTTLMPMRLWRKSVSDADGSYLIEGIPVGKVVLYVRHIRYKPVMREDIPIRAAGEPVRIDVTLKEGNVIAGRVVTETGIPIEGAYVSAANETASLVKTDREGRFTITGLGDEPANLFARAKGYGAVYARGIAPNTTDLEIKFLNPGSILGHVNPAVPSFNVLLYRFDEDLGKQLLISSPRFANAQGGSFHLPDVANGVYRVSAEAPGYARADPVVVSVGVGEAVRGILLELKPK